jgi:4-hydroxybutyrate CoA-transferase
MDSISPQAVAGLLRPGMRVYVGGSCGEPDGLAAALSANPQAAAGVTFVQFPLPGINTFDYSALHPDARMEVFFATPALSAGIAAGRIAFVPMQLRAVYDHLARGPAFDLVFLLAAPADADGRHGLAPNADFASAVVGNTRRVVVEVNQFLLAPAGAPRLRPQQVDCCYVTQLPPKTLAAVPADPAAHAIGAHVASLVNDGDCLQLGIGAIPTATLAALGDKNDLGLHSGLIDAAACDLIRRGIINGARKSVDRGQHVTGMAIGDAWLYTWLAETPQVSFRSASHTHDVGVIRQIDNFVSVNSAVEVDLFGQVNAEIVAGRQISGTGGAVDFMRGATAAPGGRSIVALLATARGGSASRIVPALPPGNAATALRTDVDYVVTEYGIARLRGRSVRQRADALIEIAAPQFRRELRAGWQRVHVA